MVHLSLVWVTHTPIPQCAHSQAVIFGKPLHMEAYGGLWSPYEPSQGLVPWVPCQMDLEIKALRESPFNEQHGGNRENCQMGH
jgi:hypothetical protein